MEETARIGRPRRLPLRAWRHRAACRHETVRHPHGVAVDGAGDVFIADWGSNRVVKVTPGGAQTSVASGV